MGSELCKTCIHTKVCMKDKNLVGDVFVMGHPMFFDNDKLYEEYKEREKQGFPCEDYMPTAESKKGHWIGVDDEPCDVYECDRCGTTYDTVDSTWDLPNYCPNCGAKMEGNYE